MSVQTLAVASGAAVLTGASTDALNSTYGQAAIEAARSRIGKPPGSGGIRGVWHYNGVTYAFRDDIEGLQCHMYESTSAGWARVSLGYHIRFKLGAVTFTEGLIVTGGTSGATATINKLALQTGTFGSGDAVGTLVLSNVLGSFQSGETLTDSSAGSATSTSAGLPTRLEPGGRFTFVTDNFGGHTSTRKMYGVDGVSHGFEYDGTIFVPIYTGMATDTPRHVIVHHKHLFYQFTGGSNQNSSIGFPYQWSAITGAAELTTGDDLVGYSNLPGEVMAIFSRGHIHILYGTSSANWRMNEQSADSGAIEWSVQDMGWPIMLDDRGVIDMRATRDYGDFKSATLSALVQPIIDSKKALVTDSIRVRSKDQYRLFFSDNTCLLMGLSKGRSTGFFLLDLGLVVRCSCATEDSMGNEILFFGADDGNVYQMDLGTSFDGANISAYVRLPYYHFGAPRRRKRVKRAVLEVDATVNTSLNFLQSFDYGDPGASSPLDQAFTVVGGGGFWGEALWNEFVWDEQVIGVANAYLDGTGYNMSMVIRSNAIYEAIHTLQALTYYYKSRGLQR